MQLAAVTDSGLVLPAVAPAVGANLGGAGSPLQILAGLSPATSSHLPTWAAGLAG